MFNSEFSEGYFPSNNLQLKYTFCLPVSTQNEICPGVLLIHGATAARGKGRVIFRDLQQLLSQEGFASLAYDTRGVGESEGEFCESTLVNRLVDAENAQRFLMHNQSIDVKRLAALGLSMGGHIIARLVGLHPEQFKEVVLVNAAAYGPQAEDKKLKPYTEFTDTIRQNSNWQNSHAFVDLLKFRGIVVTADSECDEVIPQDVKDRYRLSIARLDRRITLPGIKHAFFSATDPLSIGARALLYNEAIDSFKQNL